MEQSRLIIAIALSFLVFFIWEMLTVDKKVPPQREVQQVPITDSGERTADRFPLVEQKTQLSADDPLEQPPVAPDKIREITITSPLYRVKISEKEAAFKSFVLKQYRENVEEDAPMLEMIDPSISSGTLQISFEDRSVRGLTGAIFSTDLKTDEMAVPESGTSLSFRWKSPEGISIEKTFLFEPDSYLIGMKVTVKNGSEWRLKDRLAISLKKVFEQDGRAIGFSGPSALVDNALEQVDIDDIEDKNRYVGELKWIAVQDRYFMSSIIPEIPTTASMALAINNDNILENQYVTQDLDVDIQTKKTISFQVFYGPKKTELLKSIGYDLAKAINFGMFDVIAKPCVWIMNFLYGIIPNYGIAIIILTLLMKILLWPLGNKSYKSMAEMKKIQPLMTEIREKYKNDKQKMNEETMALYRTYKVNPLGGCLPMVVQIPIFFALYRMLYEAIELRHAPFFLWINDLSAPDRLFQFAFSIPFMSPPYGIPVLTIIMGGTMFLSQKMQPPMGDPTQAKIMMLMPIIFTVIFINFSSGLVLYWLVNNVISIGQQYYVTKKNT